MVYALSAAFVDVSGNTSYLECFAFESRSVRKSRRRLK